MNASPDIQTGGHRIGKMLRDVGICLVLSAALTFGFWFLSPFFAVVLGVGFATGLLEGIAKRVRQQTASGLPPLPAPPEHVDKNAANWRPTAWQVFWAFFFLWMVSTVLVGIMTAAQPLSAFANGFAVAILGVPLGLVVTVLLGAYILTAFAVVYETVFGALTSLGHLIAAMLRAEPQRRAAHDRVDRLRRRLLIDRYAEPNT